MTVDATIKALTEILNKALTAAGIEFEYAAIYATTVMVSGLKDAATADAARAIVAGFKGIENARADSLGGRHFVGADFLWHRS